MFRSILRVNSIARTSEPSTTKYVTELLNKNVTVRERWECVILVGKVGKRGEKGVKWVKWV